MSVEMATAGDRGAPGSRGRTADTPAAIPRPGWRDVLARTMAETKADNVPLLSAGVAFFGLLAAVPALAALASLYGLVTSPADVAADTSDLLRGAPREVRELVEMQLRAIADGRSSDASVGAAVGFLVSLWSAASGTRHAIAGANAAYDEEETRGFVRLRVLSMMLTVGLMIFVVAALAMITLLPAIGAELSLGEPARLAIVILRWPALAIAFALALAVFYRYAPDRDDAQWRWVSPGAVVATLMWLLGSLAFAAYTANLGRYNETYGSLGVVVVVMLWLFLGAFAVIFGAELNAEVERQTVKDTTEGRPRPMGTRQAYAADTLGESPASHDCGTGSRSDARTSS